MINLQIQKHAIKKQIAERPCPSTLKLKHNFQMSKTA